MKVVLKKGEKKVIPVFLKEEVLRSVRQAQSFRLAPLAQDKRRLEVVLAGDNAEIEVVGLIIGKGSDDKSMEVYITHAAPKTKSRVNVRAVLRGRSTFAFRGNVKIERGAKGADAYLRSDALLFDEAKMGDDTPALEILERDVKAGHAATVGKVDEQMLFYLMSRGIGRVQAEKMLIEGFVKPILDQIREPARSYFDASGSIPFDFTQGKRTCVKERSLVGDKGGGFYVKS